MSEKKRTKKQRLEDGKKLADLFVDALTIVNLPEELQDYADKRLSEGATTQEVLAEIYLGKQPKGAE